ncbi:MAG TPA: GNAT family N-acetyltransferase [Geobacteraceae bacterium]|nr:GNAT family N-acetyltransferase [Geobacteraceae bacterium]
MKRDRLSFKIASEPWEFEQIHCLNYRTFVEEIPQHPPNEDRRLIDRFHDENTYCIGLDGDQLAGMMAVRTHRPFSLDEKVADLDSYLPAGASVCEVRLLAVEPEFRGTDIFARLLRFTAEECIRRGYNLAVASGTVRQTRLYSRMGFIPFAGLVGTAEARYQPMYFTLQSALELFERLHAPSPASAAVPISFMPGPVEIGSVVRAAFATPPISHRSDRFLELVAETQQLLCSMTGAAGVELLLGSGTLGNDVVAAHLGVLEGRGAVLVNGEFGERLIDHAERQGLAFETIRFPWGGSYDLSAVERLLAEAGDIAWLWSVHCETSTGVLNDLNGLEAICRRHGTRLCMDCTSSLGTVPVDLGRVYLATSVSGKGLASLPGLSLVFYNHPVAPDRRLPRYLDLGYYRQKQGVPFTHSSNLVGALRQALVRLDATSRFAAIRRLSVDLRRRLEGAGFCIMGDERHVSPAVISIVLPPELPSLRIGDEMEQRGFLLSCHSGYLVERNIIQICLMGEATGEECRRMLAAFLEVTGLCRSGQENMHHGT